MQKRKKSDVIQLFLIAFQIIGIQTKLTIFSYFSSKVFHSCPWTASAQAATAGKKETAQGKQKKWAVDHSMLCENGNWSAQ